MNTEDFDVVIVGAGPAGVTTALMLAGTGFKIAVIDKAIFPRNKICGDALSGNVMNTLKRLPGNILSDFLYSFESKLPSYGIKFIAPNLKQLDIPFKKYDAGNTKYDSEYTDIPPGFTCKRIDFDNFLFSQLRNYSNISTFEDCRIDKVFTDEEYAYAINEKISFRAKIIVAADGANSFISPLLNPEKVSPMHLCTGLTAYYSNVSGFDKQNFIELYFLKDILPGYFWIFQLPDNTANVGIGLLASELSKKKKSLKSIMLDIIKHNPAVSARFKDAQLISDIKAWGLPLGSVKRKLAGNRILLTGDAASLIDPFSGEGVGNAMLSGRLAAEQIIDCFKTNDFSDSFLDRYPKTLNSKIGQELHISSVLQKMAKYPALFNLVINKANKNETLRNTFTDMLSSTSIKSRLAKPSFYLKLIFN